jgi:uncharacterized protein (TIGR04255 family)
MPTLFREPFAEVELPEAPLELSLCQIRFPVATAFDERSAAERVHDRLRDRYPVLRQESISAGQLQAGPGGVSFQHNQAPLWLFEEVDRSWHVSLTREFVALSTRAYSRRTDFVERLGHVISALEPETSVAACDRIGIRYIDRVSNQEILSDLGRYLNMAMHGAIAMNDTADDVAIVHNLSDILLELGDGARARVRAGVLPANAVPDAALTPIDELTWILDIDVFDERTVRFGSGLSDRAVELADVGYQMFRWSVTDDFIRHFGGEI